MKSKIVSELSDKEKTDNRHFIKVSKSQTIIFRDQIEQYFDHNGYLSWSDRKKKFIILGTNKPKNGLVACPSCKIGTLMVIRSRSSGKRFMGCSNYYNGCKASSPLLQKAKLRATKIQCEECKWPIVIFRYSRKQKWSRQCSNYNCKSRMIKS